jgi:hypothetical protein
MYTGLRLLLRTRRRFTESRDARFPEDLRVGDRPRAGTDRSLSTASRLDDAGKDGEAGDSSDGGCTSGSEDDAIEVPFNEIRRVMIADVTMARNIATLSATLVGSRKISSMVNGISTSNTSSSASSC